MSLLSPPVSSLAPQEILRKKRDGHELSEAEIRAYVEGIFTGAVVSEQVAAFCSFVYLNGMTDAETAALVLAMRDSGDVIDWTSVGVDPSLVIEKHSTGGVGDEKIAVLVTPLAAACGLYVPNMSAWGLDYNPGEIDMLDAVPGYNSLPDAATFARVVAETGGATIGPNESLAPADARSYKIRSTTATVESYALIAGSILSKKFAVAPAGVVITIGCGSGGYMQTRERGRVMAETMAGVCRVVGVAGVFPLTDMDSIVGTSIGGHLGMIEMVDWLTGAARDDRVTELTLDLAARMLVLGGVVADYDAGIALATEKLDDGSAAEHFQAAITALGGPADYVARVRDYAEAAAVIRPVFVDGEGYLERLDCQAVGKTNVRLGGGRNKPEDLVDYAVGMTEWVRLGARLDAEHPLCIVHAQSEEDWEAAAAMLRAAVTVSTTPTDGPGPIIWDVVTA